MSERRFLAVAALQTAVVAALAGVAAAATLRFRTFSELHRPSSDPAAQLAVSILDVLGVTLWVGLLVAPLAISAYRARAGRDLHLTSAMAATTVVLLSPAIGLVLVAAVGGSLPLFALVAVAIIAVLGTVLGSAVYEDGLGENVGVLAAGPLSVTAVVVFVLVVAVVPAGLGGHVEQQKGTAPAVTFDFEAHGNGTMTITHERGDRVEADSLTVQGDGLAAPSGVDWNGSGTVSPGDSTRVAVEDPCAIRVVFDDSYHRRAVVGTASAC